MQSTIRSQKVKRQRKLETGLLLALRKTALCFSCQPTKVAELAQKLKTHDCSEQETTGQNICSKCLRWRLGSNTARAPKDHFKSLLPPQRVCTMQSQIARNANFLTSNPNFTGRICVHKATLIIKSQQQSLKYLRFDTLEKETIPKCVCAEFRTHNVHNKC